MSEHRIIDGVEYQKFETAFACRGCVGENSSTVTEQSLCSELNDDCSYAVWKEVKIVKRGELMINDEIKNTVDTVLGFYEEYFNDDGQGFSIESPRVYDFVYKKMAMAADPEYKEFLRLKEKFGNSR